MGLALYLSFWAHVKRKVGVAIYGYGAIAISLALGLLPERLFPQAVLWGNYSTAVSVAVGVLWIFSGFLLRRELQLYYATRYGSTLEMSPLWTALFSVYYLNYCLWVVRDSI